MYVCVCVYIYIHTYIQVKWSRYRPGVIQRVGRGIALLFHDRGTRRGWMVSSTPRPHLTPGKDPVPILQEAGWAPGPVWTGGKFRPPGIRSRTVQPVVRRYTDWATWPTHTHTHTHTHICQLTLQKNGAYLEEYLESSRYLRICLYLYISQCLVEPRTMFVEPWLRNTGVVTQLDTDCWLWFISR